MMSCRGFHDNAYDVTPVTPMGSSERLESQQERRLESVLPNTDLQDYGTADPGS